MGTGQITYALVIINVHHFRNVFPFNKGFPKVEHSGNDTRIVLEENKFSKNATSYMA